MLYGNKIMEKQPFYLTKRTLPSGKKVWYYYYYNNFGERTVPKSTGETNKQKAFNFCIRLLSMNNLANKKVLFKDYAKDWFTPNCQWYKDKKSNRPIKKNTIVIVWEQFVDLITTYFIEILIIACVLFALTFILNLKKREYERRRRQELYTKRRLKELKENKK